LFTALLLSLLPLAIYCMVVLTLALSQRKVARVAKQIVDAHQRAVDELKTSRVIRLEFQDQLLQQAEFLLKLD
jgi:outer membrane lipoprotein-sorting protein